MSYISAISLLDTPPIGTLFVYQGESDTGVGGGLGGGGAGQFFFLGTPLTLYVQCTQGEGWSGWVGGGRAG